MQALHSTLQFSLVIYSYALEGKASCTCSSRQSASAWPTATISVHALARSHKCGSRRGVPARLVLQPTNQRQSVRQAFSLRSGHACSSTSNSSLMLRCMRMHARLLKKRECQCKASCIAASPGARRPGLSGSAVLHTARGPASSQGLSRGYGK